MEAAAQPTPLSDVLIDEMTWRCAPRPRRAEWQQAIAVEPTDPTSLLGRAHNRLATGDPATARTLVDQVVAGKWQDRFWQATQEAKSMQTQLAGKAP